MTQPDQPRTVRLGERARSPHRLGRHIEHDARSYGFAAPVLPRRALASKRWARRVPIWQQGDLGSCTGHAAAAWLATDNATRPGVTAHRGIPVDHDYAVLLYSRATDLDSFPGRYKPEDTGSSGIAAAKALREAGAAVGYRHAFTPGAVLTALQTGPVMLGLPWYASMFNPTADGRIVVDAGTGLAGGHELLADELNIIMGRVWVQQSWGEWGVDGRGWFTLSDLAALLDADGDATIPTPAAVTQSDTQPAPGGCLGRLAKAFRPRR